MEAGATITKKIAVAKYIRKEGRGPIHHRKDEDKVTHLSYEVSLPQEHLKGARKLVENFMEVGVRKSISPLISIHTGDYKGEGHPNFIVKASSRKGHECEEIHHAIVQIRVKMDDEYFPLGPMLS